MRNTILSDETVTCFHCGEACVTTSIQAQGKTFCCTGCKMVYEILNESGMCDYYNMNASPGISQRVKTRENKFFFLNDETIAKAIIAYKDEEHSHVAFYLPQMHCSSCMWLLEHLYKLNNAVVSSKINFTKKEVDIVFRHADISLCDVAELLTAVGYEPHISLQNLAAKKPPADKSKIYKLGVAGFCFANIMLLSFPEYFGVDISELQMLQLFRCLNVFLSLPVFFYSASEFYETAWKSIRHGFLHIDAPIVLAIIVTFSRSVYEVVTNSGGGYFDSMSGIVFFMLVGRVLTEKTYDQLNFERDFTSYFPLAVTRISNGKKKPVQLPAIKLNDTLHIYSNELIPADGILTRGKALIDYSFVTGESFPVEKEMGEIVYAGGKQIGGSIEILVVKEVSQSYLTKLWNRSELKNNEPGDERSFVHFLSKYFTYIVFGIAISTGAYWYFHDPLIMWKACTSVLIVACPCALLLCHTFTNSNIIRLLAKKGFYLRNGQVIEDIANTDYIVFDKTGTLTNNSFQQVEFEGEMPDGMLDKIAALAAQSMHPMSKAIADIGRANATTVLCFKEDIGKGIKGIIDGEIIALGSKFYITGSTEKDLASAVYVKIDGDIMGRFVFKNEYRNGIGALIRQLQKDYIVAVLSGDNEREKDNLQSMLGEEAQIHFNQGPEDKLNFIKAIQHAGHKVMMIGDGLNDAGALKQANAGISLTEDSNNFTPASDGIMEVNVFHKLKEVIGYCKSGKRIVMMAFIVSILYNIIGIFFAITGQLSPMIAAILMPSSSISIVLITFGLSSFLGRRI